MDYTKRFDGKGEIYAKARPKYSLALFDYLKNTLHIPQDSVFADVGSGTGIFTEQLLNEGYRVYAVEPNYDMRKKAEEKLKDNKNFTSVVGCEKDMNLPSNSVEYITAAQAFHWFDSAAFKKECKRVLKPNGKVVIVYNFRINDVECTKALSTLHHKYNPDFHGFSNGVTDKTFIDFFDGKCDIFRSDNSLSYDREAYVNRVLSSSYSLKEDDPRYEEYLAEINDIFDKFEYDGRITIPNKTVAYIGEV